MIRARSHVVILGFIFTGVVLLFLGLIAGHGLNVGWGASQWGPLSAWVSGILTAGAVTVALVQTVANRRDTEANKRAEQAKSIPPIWVAVAELDEAYQDYKDAMLTGERALKTTDESHRGAAAEQMELAYRKWRDHARKVEMAFEPALITITEPRTQQAVTNSYALFSEFVHGCFIAKKNIQYRQPENFKIPEHQLRRLRTSRREVILIARLHLIQAAPWKVEPAYLALEDGT